ncbi:MAG: tetratricopeptide repeat protein, partial [Myxococcales bacterium]|nr:tetratricopeptide repeat protein [Myxococcales bacterium]
ADNAAYWVGEVFFVQQQYEQALRSFEGLIVSYPKGNKVPDALLRAGLCHFRMGHDKKARAYFKRLKELFPDTVAARLASREDDR